MSTSVPIIYTGNNVARPDWKSFNRDVNARIAQVGAQRQQQAQFDALQNERITKEFLKNLDIDELNSTNEGLIAQKYQIYENLENQLTRLVQDEGDVPGVKSRVTAKILNAEANQKMARLNAADKNWTLDKATILKDKEGVYDLKKAKEKIFDLKDITNYESILDQVLRDVSPDEVASAIYATIENPNTHAWVAGNVGQQFTNKETRDAQYYNFDVENNEWKPKHKEQVAYIKSAIAASGQKSVNYLRSIDEEWNDVNKKEREVQEQLALNNGLEKEDAKYLNFNNKHNIFQTRSSSEPKKVKTETDKTKYKGGYPISDGKIDLTNPKTTNISYGDGTESDNYIQLGDNAVTNKKGTINGLKIVSGGGEEFGKTVSMKDINSWDIVGVDDIGGKQYFHYNIRVGSDKPKMKDGKIVYNSFGYSGNKENIWEQAYNENLKGNTDKKSKAKAKQYADEVVSGLSSNDIVTQKRTLDGIAPVNTNPGYGNKFILGESKTTAKATEDTYVYNGNEISMDKIEKAALESKMSVEEYMKEAGITKK